MTGWLPREAAEIFGAEAVAAEAYDLLTVDVPASSWVAALTAARDELGCTFFDWLSAVDEPGTGFRVCAHLVALGERTRGTAGGSGGGTVRRLLVRTTVGHDDPALESATGVFAGAAWHERETYEMFGVAFTGHPGLDPLLLPDEFEGHPLRKDFVLAARVAKAWPGAKEPGEPHDGGPRRRQMLPPGVPDPNEWGPLKGQLPPAPTRPARTARAAGPAGERPPRRNRTAAGGSASQQPGTPDAPWQKRAGAPGEPPAEGAPGTDGVQDTDGAQGAQGPQSTEGPQDAQGPQDTEGPQGTQGPQGTEGGDRT